MVAQTFQQSSRSSSVTVAEPSRPSTQRQPSSFMTVLKKPFQGWSKELLRARDDDDDHYNFASGARRGAHLYLESEEA
jgi:hypothetical protein